MQLKGIMPTDLTGSVASTIGMTACVAGFPAPVGALVEIEREAGDPLQGEVVGFRDDLTIVYPFSDVGGIRRGNRVRMTQTLRRISVGDGLLGRVINSAGQVIDGKPAPILRHRVPLHRDPPAATTRPRIQKALSTGVRVIDGMLTCGQGQRMGIFAGSGVGKSTVMGMMARHTSADVNVIAVIGERGREVNEFIQRDLGPQGLARSVVCVATSDQTALSRVQSALTATAVAEYFRDQGKNVFLLMDSLTRFATAQREIGLARGEPPATRGYPPSVFATLPKLVERAGQSARGSITAFYTVLVEGDDTNEPVSDTVRGLLDGHTVLTRKLATQGHYPAVDVLESISRLMTELASKDQQDTALLIRKLLAAYRDHEDLISIGAYRQGSNPMVDLAIRMRPHINQFLLQGVDDSSSVEQARQALTQLVNQCAIQSQQAQQTQTQGA